MSGLNTLVVATTNPGKVREIQHEFVAAGLTSIAIQMVTDYPGYRSPHEDQPTFLGNAILKAVAAATHTGSWAIADDSGLCVDTLGGRPGIFSARYAGPNATDAQNNAKLLADLSELNSDRHPAAYVCAVAIARPDAVAAVFHARLDGEIIFTSKGNGGFGYDPYFYLPGLGRTAAELSLDEKSRISHRGLAIRAAIRWIQKNISQLAP